jgi:hypothetical protein
MTTEEMLKELLNTYPDGKHQIDCIEISHSLFSQSYFFTREPEGISATITNADASTQVVAFSGTNFEPVLNQKRSDLDSDFSFTLPDPDNLLDDELDLIPLDNTEKVVVVYRVYLSEDLTEEAELHRLEVLRVNQEKGVFTIDCGLPQLNWQKTGIIYDYDTFQPLRAL